MQLVARWARTSCPPVFIEIGWSNTREEWVAAATGITTWPTVKGAPGRYHQRWAAWVATLLTRARPVLERLAAGGLDPRWALRVVAHVELGRVQRQRRVALFRKTQQLRTDARALEKAAVILRRYHEQLVDQTPMAEVHGYEHGPHGRRLYAWSLEILGWAAAALRAVPRSRGRVQESHVLVAALALRRLGLTVPEIGDLIGSARLSYSARDDERTKGWLRRAKSDPRIQTAARRLAAIDKVKARSRGPRA
jgi:hypothetical protein